MKKPKLADVVHINVAKGHRESSSRRRHPTALKPLAELPQRELKIKADRVKPDDQG